MSQTSNRVVFDHDAYIDNRNRWTYEQFIPYMGQWVAWNGDGTSIVAHHPDFAEVARRTDELGYASDEVLLDYIPGADEPDTHL